MERILENAPTRDEVLDTLAQIVEESLIGPDEVTKHDLAARCNLAPDKAKSYLDGLVEKGMMTRRLVLDASRKWTSAYRFINTEEE